MTTYRIRFVPLFAAIALVAGCGSSAGHSTATSSDDAVKAAMNRWFAATTPAQACAGMTTAFRRFLGDGDPNKCAANLPKKISLPNAGGQHYQATITKITYTHGLAKVRATFAGDSNNYYFAKEHGVWKLNSIGIIPTAGPPPSSKP